MRTLAVVGLFACGACFASLDGFTGGPTTSPPNDGGAEASSALPGPVDADAGVDASKTPEPSSCKELSTAKPGTNDGVYPLAGMELYCDMTTAGGGWTLVARSAGASPAGSFGWRRETGDLHNDALPYSLGVLNLDLPFTEILVGARDAEKGLTNAYELSVTRTQLLDSPKSGSHVAMVASAKGTCAPSGGPSMLHYVGYTNLSASFRFRDVTLADGAETGYGLFPNGFGLNYADCEEAGDLQGLHGEIFVR